MQSVYKFPLAIATFRRIDEGKLFLQQKILLRKKYLPRNTWSPLAEKYPKGNVRITLEELLRYTVSESDNNGCDILFRLLGGPPVVDSFIHGIGIRDIAIVASEAEMHKDWSVQFGNWCTPAAMSSLLRLFDEDRLLSEKGTADLRKMLTETSTGPKRIKGMLPEGSVVAHKTGTSGANEEGFSAALNDAGIIALPDGKHVIVVVFITNSTADLDTQEQVIATLAHIVWQTSANARRGLQ
jgi:beta-lactamase class A